MCCGLSDGRYLNVIRLIYIYVGYIGRLPHLFNENRVHVSSDDVATIDKYCCIGEVVNLPSFKSNRILCAVCSIIIISSIVHIISPMPCNECMIDYSAPGKNRMPHNQFIHLKT